jgi:hypothetical protein
MAIRKHLKITFLVISTLALILLAGLPLTAANFSTWIPISSGVTKDINSLWRAVGSNIFAVGQSGTIIHYNGSTWTSMGSGTTNDLNYVWGAADTDVFAVGKSGVVTHYDGSMWTLMDSGVKGDLYSVWGSDGANVFAVGSSGVILYYDGGTWSSLVSTVTKDLTCVWGAAFNSVYAVGNTGTILHYNGAAWSPLKSGITNDLNCVWGTGTSVFAAGDSGTILRYDGATWSSMNSGTAGDLYSIWGVSSTDVFVVGESGTIAHYDGSKWSSMNRDTLNSLRAVRGISSNDVFCAGGSGLILRYLPPLITSISQNQGDQGAILNVVINGSNLGGASEVRFGTGIAVNSFTILSSTQINANITIVAGSVVGTRDVSVITPGGNFTLPNSFSVQQALPTIASVSPDKERQAVTLDITITGTKLSGATEVQMGTGIAVNSFKVLSSNQLTVNISIAPDAVTGTRDVSVATPGGSVTLPNSFSIKQALPTITSINPALGNQETTFNVTIDGTNLGGASDVWLGTGIIVNKFSVLSSNQISATISITSGSEVGVRDVSVATPGGSFTLPGSFRIKQAQPVITSISPDNGSQGATLNVNITGLNLSGATEVRLGTGIAVNSFTIPDTNQITANITILAGADTAARDVSVTTPGGSISFPNSFTVKQGLPVITSISPVQGSQGETITVIISGRNFSGTTSVSFGAGIAANSFTNLSPTQLSAGILIDAEAATGVRDVTVTTPGGSSTLGNSFTIKQKSIGTLIVALIWVGIAIVVLLFILILNLLRRKRANKIF